MSSVDINALLRNESLTDFFGSDSFNASMLSKSNHLMAYKELSKCFAVHLMMFKGTNIWKALISKHCIV
jgi:hypothetical protein